MPLIHTMALTPLEQQQITHYGFPLLGLPFLQVPAVSASYLVRSQGLLLQQCDVLGVINSLLHTQAYSSHSWWLLAGTVTGGPISTERLLASDEQALLGLISHQHMIHLHPCYLQIWANKLNQSLKSSQQILSKSFLSHHNLNKLCWWIWKEQIDHTFCLLWLFTVFNLLVTRAGCWTLLLVSFKSFHWPLSLAPDRSRIWTFSMQKLKHATCCINVAHSLSKKLTSTWLYLFTAEYYSFAAECKSSNKDIPVSNYVYLLLFQICHKFQWKNWKDWARKK